MKLGYQLKAQRLTRENYTVAEIASMLGCSQHDVRLAINFKGRLFMRKAATRIRKSQKIKSSPLKDETLGARSAGIGAELRESPIPADVLLERDRRMMLAPRTLTAARMGDPPSWRIGIGPPMTDWGAILEKPQAEFPELNFVRFVARKFYSAPYRLDVLFLDLGCGGGANSEFLEDKGFTVISLDSAPNSRANIIADLTTWDYPKGKFDCVLDNNTLCHIVNPPMLKIRNTLKRGGTFFSVAPSHLTARGHLEGKGFCRCAARSEIERLYSPFSKIRLDTASYPNNGQQIVSWIIEATK